MVTKSGAHEAIGAALVLLRHSLGQLCKTHFKAYARTFQHQMCTKYVVKIEEANSP